MDEIKIRRPAVDLQKESAKVQRDTTAQQKANSNSDTAAAKLLDTVDVSMSQLISTELDPTKMAAERREKIERLKKLIESGEYNPPASAIAAAVGQDIVFEVLDSSSLLEE